MSYSTQLNEEINAVLDALAEEGREWKAPWVAHEICRKHAPGLVALPEAEFWRHCGYTECRREVTRIINRRAGDRAESDGGQITMPGYEHLHAYYVVERDGEEVGVPVHDLTSAEIEKKKAMYRAMGTACFAHAAELEAFQRSREASA